MNYKDIHLDGQTYTLLQKLVQQAAPLLSEQVSSGQTAISTDHAQVGDAPLDKVVCSSQTALTGTKLFTASAANDCSALWT